jgi:hypothetical protein
MTAKVQASEQHNLHDLDVAAVFTKPFARLPLPNRLLML